MNGQTCKKQKRDITEVLSGSGYSRKLFVNLDSSATFHFLLLQTCWTYSFYMVGKNIFLLTFLYIQFENNVLKTLLYVIIKCIRLFLLFCLYPKVCLDFLCVGYAHKRDNFGGYGMHFCYCWNKKFCVVFHIIHNSWYYFCYFRIISFWGFVVGTFNAIVWFLEKPLNKNETW